MSLSLGRRKVQYCLRTNEHGQTTTDYTTGETIAMTRLLHFASILFCLSFAAFSNPRLIAQDKEVQANKPLQFSVMTWNIWHGGKEDGEDIGPKRVVDVIKESKADIIAMQETYGSGERISKALGFHFLPRGTNVSIHSRFPILEDISVFAEFKCVGGLIELPGKQRLAFYSIWLPYNKEIWEEGTRHTTKPDEMIAACQASCDDLQKIKSLIEERLSDTTYDDVPIVIAGDFNSMSHLDYIPSAIDQHEVVIDWPTSHVLHDDDFKDSFRETNPEVQRMSDRTWTPRFPKQQQDRIDFVYYRDGENETGLIARSCKMIDQHPENFPSDHAAVVAEFSIPATPIKNKLKVACYNIKHGQGTDNRVDLDRTASLLRNLNPDIVGMQEVDNRARRSGDVDQAQSLGKQLKMESAFGSFMKFQGGEYGLAILSRYPIIKKHEIRLPDGNEPRVALACEIRLPTGQSVMAVNLHFDWVKDDKFRFAQAQKLSRFLETVEIPYVLIGDFNDTLGSRTLELLSTNAIEANKPDSDELTFSSTKPYTEIDFLFAAPKSKWSVHHCRVFDAPKTSDHRPVMATFELVEE